jgi:hypothetical protein
MAICGGVRDFQMMGDWIRDMLGDQTLDRLSYALLTAYGWTKEWQVLLAGLLVVIASLIVARAIRKAPVSQPIPQSVPAQARLDLRREPRALVPLKSILADPSGELASELEHLRSLIRSALSAFTLTAGENSPVQFLCQRVARLRPERFALPASASPAQRGLYAEVLEQLDNLRQQLKQEINPAEMSGTLIKLNTSARNLIATLEPQAVKRRQAGSDQR